MAQKLLIDATHAEETRVVVLDGNKVDEFDFETASRKQNAGSIYLAKVTRVEPSLQAAFVDYGGNRHGFLAFSEIHPDYYQIPAADRAALLAEERAMAQAADDESDDAAARKADGAEDDKPAPKVKRSSSRRRGKAKTAAPSADDAPENGAEEQGSAEPAVSGAADDSSDGSGDESGEGDDQGKPRAQPHRIADKDAVQSAPVAGMDVVEPEGDGDTRASEKAATRGTDDAETYDEPYVAADHAAEHDTQIEAISDGDAAEEVRVRAKPRMRRYKIQEVIKVRQIMLVQVVKEERGNKGAALTTYLSLAGRYCVLMPNTARGGGISRKITTAADRQKLKSIASELSVPEGAGLIIRTAGANRTRAEIKRDYEYLMRLWEQIRDLTLKSIAPAQIYEEGNLIKRAIRDLYSRDIDEVLVEGEEGYRVAKDFMKMIMPSHARNVKQYTDSLPLFARYQVESYLAGMFNPSVQLPSGGYIVIGVTEALVAIDVNSGRATREGSIEDTAVKTNLEAAEEIARQLRLRDLAGLIVIDFIDMEERRNNAAVEKMLKDKLKSDRARIQVGRISGFGLLEMSRQRLRPGMLEATTQPCPHCHGTGLIRSDDSMALTIIRQLEEEGTRGKSREVLVRAAANVVNFLFNAKREHIAQVEARYGMSIRLEADPAMVSPDFTIEKFKTATRAAAPPPPVVSLDASMMTDIDENQSETLPETAGEMAEAIQSPAVDDGEKDQPRKKRRRRRRKRGGQSNGGTNAGDNGDNGNDTAGDGDVTPAEGDTAAEGEAEKPAKRSRSRSRAPKRGTDDAPSGDASDQDAAAVAAVAVAEAASGDEEPAKPAKKTRSRTRKPAKPKADAKVDADAPADAMSESAPDADAAEVQAAQPKPKPKRARAPRKSTAKAAEPVSEPVSEPASSGTAAEAVATPDSDTAMTNTAPSDPVAAPEPDAPAPKPVAEAQEPAPAPSQPASEEKGNKPAAKPRRRGWWALGS